MRLCRRFTPWLLFVCSTPALVAASAAEAASLTGLVTVLEDGSSVVDVAVWAVEIGGRVHTAATDPQGRYTFSDLPAGRYRLRVRPAGAHNVVGAWNGGHYAYCQASWIRVSQSVPVEEVHFALPRAAELSGVVVDALSGLPVPDAQLSLRGLDVINSNTNLEGATDPDGSFRLAGLDSFVDAPGNYLLEVRAPAYPRQWWPSVFEQSQAQVIEVQRGTSISDLRVELHPGGSISGLVRNADGPLQGASVQAYHPGTGTHRNSITGADGSYIIGGMPSGDSFVQASAVGHARTWHPDAALQSLAEPVPVQLGAGEAPADLLLPSEGRVRVAPAGPQGPVEGVTVALVVDGVETAAVAVSDALGLAELTNLPPGRWTVSAHPSPGSGYLAATPVELGPQASGTILGPIQLDLAREVGLSGWVERYDGYPHVSAAVTWFDRDGSTRATTSDLEGRFALLGLPQGSLGRVQVSVTPFCSSDPSWVSTWNGNARTSIGAAELEPSAGVLELNMPIVLPWDDDRDGMGDLWELIWGLNSGRDDADEDPDHDGTSNLAEYEAGSDPWDGLAKSCSQNAEISDKTHRMPLASAFLVWAAWRRRTTRLNNGDA